MRVVAIETKPGFQPFSFNVTIENANELLDLYHRVNMSHDNLIKCIDQGNSKVRKPEHKPGLELWDILNSKLLFIGEKS